MLGEEAVDLRLLRGKEGFLELGIGFKLEEQIAARVWGKAGGRASLFMICFCSSTISAFFSDVRSRSATCRATHRGGSQREFGYKVVRPPACERRDYQPQRGLFSPCSRAGFRASSRVAVPRSRHFYPEGIRVEGLSIRRGVQARALIICRISSRSYSTCFAARAPCWRVVTSLMPHSEECYAESKGLWV